MEFFGLTNMSTPQLLSDLEFDIVRFVMDEEITTPTDLVLEFDMSVSEAENHLTELVRRQIFTFDGMYYSKKD